MRFLVDADVLSEATKPQPNPPVVDWLGRHAPDLVINPIILGELEFGILLLPPGRRRKRLLDWFAGGLARLNTIDIDATTATIWAQLLADLKRKGKTMPINDSLIAASAKQHNLAVATRNTTDFQHSGVQVINPFEGG